MGKLRVSYTLLNLWGRGLVEEAVQAYFHMNRKPTEAMEFGKKFHEDMEEHIKKYNCFPDWFFNWELKLPESEKVVVVNYNDQFDLKAILDCYDSATKTLFEYKTGVQDSLAWTRTDQIPLYFLACELANLPVEKAILIHHNQHENKSDFTIVWNHPEFRERGRNIIDSYAPEILSFFESEGLL